MENHTLTNTAKEQLIGMIRGETGTSAEDKILEFGSGRYTIAEALHGVSGRLSCTDKFDVFPDTLRDFAEIHDINLIPNAEIEEDCYFGRFQVVYTNFGFFGIPHLVDEIMRLRRLLLKGGKMIIVDCDENGFQAECLKQLKRCGFLQPRTETFELDGKTAFLITAEK